MGQSPTSVEVEHGPTSVEVGHSPTSGLERARSFQPGPGGLPMGRLWRASAVGGVRPPLAPGVTPEDAIIPPL